MLPDATRSGPRRALDRVAALPAGRRAKWLVVLAWIGILFAAAPLAGKVGDVEDNETFNLARGAETSEHHELRKRFSSEEPIPAVVVYVRDDGITADDRAKVDRDRNALAAHSADRRAPGVRPSSDGRALMTTVAVPLTEDGFTDKVKEIRDLAHAGAPAGLQVKVAGPAGQAADEVEVFSDLDAKLMLATVAVVTVLLLLTYRSPVIWLLPLISVALASQVANAFIYLLGKHADMPVDGMGAGILTVLVFGVGTDYALLLIARYREELHSTVDRHEAMAAALRRSRGAIVASAATVVAGLLCLLAADINSSRGLGGVGAVGVLCGLAAMITLLPALLVIFGRWIFWPFVPRPGEPAKQGRLWAGVAASIAARPRTIWLATAVVLVGLGLIAGAMRIGPSQEEMFRTVPESVAGQRLVAAHYPAGSSAPADVIAAAPKASQVTDAARSTPGVVAVQESGRSQDGQLVQMTVTLRDAADSDAAERTVERLRDAVHNVDGAGAVVGGPTAEALDGSDGASRDRLLVIPLVLLVVLTILILLLRAVAAPVLLLGTIVLSYFAALGAAWLLLKGPLGVEALDNSTPLLGFIFLVALGIDYNIFLMHRVRQETVASGHRTGVLRGLTTTGGVITSAGLVLAATFSVLMNLPITFMAGLGALVAVGVLLDTFVVRSLLVPALALDVGRRIWWPGHLARPRRVATPGDLGQGRAPRDETTPAPRY
ncbi:MMPL family transporter [Actinomadura spongiicola]|uniref:MMPL family transporter n=1 Tax=Actinomadura spongiicola TaxID=2303421 RepID=A0A372GPJ0_9ACTN|nr:MMPL family transporter [Actinomadura spongiicola]RFS87311.1 MMPL family transporter [Actinomadura spongiicola]